MPSLHASFFSLFSTLSYAQAHVHTQAHIHVHTSEVFQHVKKLWSEFPEPRLRSSRNVSGKHESASLDPVSMI